MKYVKVSPKAESFYASQIALFMRKGEVAKLSATQLANPKVNAALKGGHLEYADEEAYNEWIASQKALEPKTPVPAKTTAPPAGSSDNGGNDDDDDDENELYKDIPTNSAKAIRQWLKDTYELDAEDIEKIDALTTKKELTEFAKAYIDEVEGSDDDGQ